MARMALQHQTPVVVVALSLVEAVVYTVLIAYIVNVVYWYIVYIVYYYVGLDVAPLTLPKLLLKLRRAAVGVMFQIVRWPR